MVVYSDALNCKIKSFIFFHILLSSSKLEGIYTCKSVRILLIAGCFPRNPSRSLLWDDIIIFRIGDRIFSTMLCALLSIS